ncbi:PREDICTED: uncharacterized protein LOC109189598 [Ipomoea nil]|uniref:uncharacterized protein LOC109189598 n=1 Tax=Ipomoea nil TaxID=35883 RepID=UPI0009016205|nr:PREDICTED: uncharacterized protein LOC109189598 [Ipomoea nil]
MADSGGTFPAADAEIELNPEKNKEEFQVNSVSSNLSSNAENKEREEASKKAKEKEKKDAALQTLKTTIIFSAVFVAVAGAFFAITKKLREK